MFLPRLGSGRKRWRLAGRCDKTSRGHLLSTVEQVPFRFFLLFFSSSSLILSVLRKILTLATILLIATLATLILPSKLKDTDQAIQEKIRQEQIEANRLKVEQNLLDLKNKLAIEVKKYKGEVAISITELESRATVSINGDEIYFPASTIKLLILVGALKDIENGKYSLSVVEKNITDMMTISSNTAANNLINKVGFSTLTKLLEEHEMTDTIFIHGFSPADGEIPRVTVGSNAMTTNDANIFWEKLFNGELLSSENTKKALTFTKLPNVNLIYSPKGTVASHKPGYIEVKGSEVYHDSGVVQTKDFAYAVTFFSRNNPTHEEGGEFGKKLTKIIYDWFSENYE